MALPPSKADALFTDPALDRSIDDLVARVTAAAAQLAPGASSDREPARDLAKKIAERRGRPLFYDGIVGSGLGRGPLVELADGSVKYDFITAIGTNFFGHGDPDMLKTAVKAALQDVAMQGNLHPNREYHAFLEALLSRAPGKLKRGWLAPSGADANENALKIARQRRGGAKMVIAFEHAFAGRTSAMAEITDQPGYRKGQPLFGQALYVPFFDKNDPAGSTARAERALRDHLHRYGDQICAQMFELVQGEGGFNSAPREFFEKLMRISRDAKLVIWVDEIQTFGRTRQLFATQMLNLGDYVDMITVGKLVQSAATLFVEELTPDPGLLSGTFSGSTVSLALGRRVVERLTSEGHYGDDGKHAKLEKIALAELARLADGPCKGMLSQPHAIGTMVSFVPFDGAADVTNRVLRAAYERGVIAFLAGHNPTKVRMLLPGGAITEADLRAGLALMGDALCDVSAALRQEKDKAPTKVAG